MNLDAIVQAHNRVLDFGPPMNYPVLGTAYTVGKISLWYYHTENHLEMVAFEKGGENLPRGRAEGTLYSLTDQQLENLDTLRGHGVTSERKRVQVYIPGWDEEGPLLRPSAYVYFNVRQVWLPRMAENSEITTVKRGVIRITEKSNFKVCPRRAAEDRFLNNRFSFLPEYNTPRYVKTEGVLEVGDRVANPKININCATHNATWGRFNRSFRSRLRWFLSE